VAESEFEGFEWDEEKSAATFRDRGIDFETAAGVFDGAYVEREDLRTDYGEHRYLVTGETQGNSHYCRLDATLPKSPDHSGLARHQARGMRVP